MASFERRLASTSLLSAASATALALIAPSSSSLIAPSSLSLSPSIFSVCAMRPSSALRCPSRVLLKLLIERSLATTICRNSSNSPSLELSGSPPLRATAALNSFPASSVAMESLSMLMPKSSARIPPTAQQRRSVTKNEIYHFVVGGLSCFSPTGSTSPYEPTHIVLAGNVTWILACGKNKPQFLVRFKKFPPRRYSGY